MDGQQQQQQQPVQPPVQPAQPAQQTPAATAGQQTTAASQFVPMQYGYAQQVPNFVQPAAFQQPQPQQAQGAVNPPSAPTPPIAFQQTIAQQNEQIEALMAQNAALNAQVVSLINNGAQMPAQPQQAQQAQATPAQAAAQQMQVGQFPNIYEPFNPSSLASGQDYSLEGLAEEIGKRE